MSYAVAFILAIGVEFPTMRLENMFFFRSHGTDTSYWQPSAFEERGCIDGLLDIIFSCDRGSRNLIFLDHLFFNSNF